MRPDVRRPGDHRRASRAARAATRGASLLVVIVLLGGCDGGLIGTGTGPDEPIVRPGESLRGRIGTDLPAALLDPDALASALGDTPADGPDSRADGPRSAQWRTLVEPIAAVEALRLESEAFLIRLDAVLPTILSRCDARGERDCRLPPGSVEGRYTDALLAEIDAVYVRALGANGERAAALDGVRAELQSRRGSSYRLGEVTLVPSDGQPYDIDLTTSLDDALGGRRLRVRSNAAGTRRELTIARAVGSIVEREYIGFATELPGERFTYTRDAFVGSGIEDRFDVSIVADGSPERRVLLDARLRERVGSIVDDVAFRARVDDRQGFARARVYEEIGAIRRLSVTEESFAADGTLLAGSDCASEPGPAACTDPTEFTRYGPSGAAVTDNPLYATEDGFETLVAMNDALRVEVVDLPTDIVDFQVRAADDALPLAERDLLCTGVQLAPDETRLYCPAPVERLSASVVVAVDVDSGAVTELPRASVVSR